MPPIKKIRGPRRKYYVTDPVMIIQIGEWERLINHLVNLSLRVNKADPSAKILIQTHTQLLKAARQKLKAAKAHYSIKMEEHEDLA